MANHDLNKPVYALLLASAQQDLAACKLLADWLDELNPYAVEARYGTIDPEGLDRTRALQAAEQVLEWANRQSQSTNAE